jgi:hypothetical protein
MNCWTVKKIVTQLSSRCSLCIVFTLFILLPSGFRFKLLPHTRKEETNKPTNKQTNNGDIKFPCIIEMFPSLNNETTDARGGGGETDDKVTPCS